MRRSKLTAILCALAALFAAGVARAAPIPVAIFAFADAGDLSSMIKISGGGCTPKVTKAVMTVKIRDASPQCTFRDSVVADSSDKAPNQDIQAAVGVDPRTVSTMRAKAYVSVVARASSTGRYELRVVPAKQRWLLIRDPDGAPPPVVLDQGTGKFIKGGTGATTQNNTQNSPNTAKSAAVKKTTPKTTSVANNILRLIVGGDETHASLSATINGSSVFSGLDPNSGPPVGRFTGVALGNKTDKAATGVIGAFDDITIRVPNPA